MKNIKSKELHIFALNNDFTGSNRALSSAIRQLIADGIKIVLHTSTGEGHLSNIREVVYKKNFYRYSSHKILTLINFCISQTYQFLYILLVLKPKRHIVLGNTVLSVCAVITARLRGCTSIIYVHETFINPVFFKVIAKFFIEKTATHIIYVSKFVEQELKIQHPLSSVVYNISPFQCSPLKKRCEVFTVLMPTSPRDYKGVPEFFGLAQNNLDMNFHLVLSCSLAVSTRYLSRFKVPSNVKITLQPSSMSDVYKTASVVLNLSRTDICREAFGLTIIEAFSFGLPVIVPPVGGPAEIVRNNIDGFQVDSRDTDQISSLLIALSSDKNLYQKMVLKISEIGYIKSNKRIFVKC